MPAPARLFVTDLDGTLLDDRAELSEFAVTELNRLLAAGLPLTIATARSLPSIQHLMRGVNFHLPVIELNGGFVTDFHTGNHLACHPLNNAVAYRVDAYGQEHGLPPIITTHTPDGDHVYTPPPLNEGITWLLNDRDTAHDGRLREIADTTHDFMAEDVMSMTFIGREEQVRPVQHWVHSELSGQAVADFYENKYHRGWFWMSIHAHNATKAVALQDLSRILKVPMDVITVFGDNNNDIPMFLEAGHAVAVGNASETVQAYADEIIGTNNLDSVVSYLAANWPL